MARTLRYQTVAVVTDFSLFSFLAYTCHLGRHCPRRSTHGSLFANEKVKKFFCNVMGSRREGRRSLIAGKTRVQSCLREC